MKVKKSIQSKFQYIHKCIKRAIIKKKEEKFRGREERREEKKV